MDVYTAEVDYEKKWILIKTIDGKTNIRSPKEGDFDIEISNLLEEYFIKHIIIHDSSKVKLNLRWIRHSGGKTQKLYCIETDDEWVRTSKKSCKEKNSNLIYVQKTDLLKFARENKIDLIVMELI